MGALTNPSWDETTCPSCGVLFGSSVVAFRRKDGGTIYCPNGHTSSWRETEEMKLRKQLETANRKAQMEADSRRTAEVEMEKAKRRVKKLEKRVVNGVCPCCNRSFSNTRLALHIKTKHPDFAQ